MTSLLLLDSIYAALASPINVPPPGGRGGADFFPKQRLVIWPAPSPLMPIKKDVKRLTLIRDNFLLTCRYVRYVSKDVEE